MTEKRISKIPKVSDREFPIMFDIADRARKHKAKKAGNDK